MSPLTLRHCTFVLFGAARVGRNCVPVLDGSTRRELTGIHHVLTKKWKILQKKIVEVAQKSTLTGGPQKSIPNGIPRLQKKFGSNTFWFLRLFFLQIFWNQVGTSWEPVDQRVRITTSFDIPVVWEAVCCNKHLVFESTSPFLRGTIPHNNSCVQTSRL